MNQDLDRVFHEMQAIVRQSERQMQKNRQIWQDATRQEFDAQFWQDVPQELNEYLTALQEIIRIIEDIERRL